MNNIVITMSTNKYEYLFADLAPASASSSDMPSISKNLFKVFLMCYKNVFNKLFKNIYA